MKEYTNEVLQTDPGPFLFHGIYWSIMLIVVFPIFGWLSLFQALVKVFCFQRPKKLKRLSSRAVYITGCDKGLGRELAYVFVEKGFVVFVSCLTDEGVQQYKGIENIIPLQADVTSEQDCMRVAELVRNRMIEENKKIESSGGDPSKKMFLHALINNAGIGYSGLVDWVSVNDYQRVMDVNFYGTLRTTKAFLPLLKSQCRDYSGARVINVSSVAGLFAGTVGSSIYASSKHSVEAYTSCLRMELRRFGIHVTTINPSGHDTELVSQVIPSLKRLWNEKLDLQTRKQYGEAYFSSFLGTVENVKELVWDLKHVVDEIVNCVELVSPPAQSVIGIDGKYFVCLVRILPMWAQMYIFEKMQLSKISNPVCM